MSRAARSRGACVVEHAASRGEEASARAVAEGRVELVLADPDTGERQSFGWVVRRRRCGAYRLSLARDDARGLWWVVALRDLVGGVVVLGYDRGRAGAAARVFDEATEDLLDQAAAAAGDASVGSS